MMGRRITVALDEDVRTKLETAVRSPTNRFQENVNEALRLGLLCIRCWTGCSDFMAF
jgi:hypothetical protein